MTLKSEHALENQEIAKMKRKDELKDTRSNSSPLLCIFEHRIENWWGDVATPLRRTRVKVKIP